jgi:hypothetical protein
MEQILSYLQKSHDIDIFGRNSHVPINTPLMGLLAINLINFSNIKTKITPINIFNPNNLSTILPIALSYKVLKNNRHDFNLSREYFRSTIDELSLKTVFTNVLSGMGVRKLSSNIDEAMMLHLALENTGGSTIINDIIDQLTSSIFNTQARGSPNNDLINFISFYWGCKIVENFNGLTTDYNVI